MHLNCALPESVGNFLGMASMYGLVVQVQPLESRNVTHKASASNVSHSWNVFHRERKIQIHLRQSSLL